jgi:hypothetical protein
MFSNREQHAAQIDDARAIQSQRLNRGAPNRDKPNDEGEIEVPGKMIIPRLRAWVK